MKKVSLFVLLSIAFACKKQSNETDFSKPEEIKKSELLTKAEAFFKSVSTVNYDTVSQDRIILGEKLYFDKELSKNKTISCNSCHNLSAFGVDNKAVSQGDSKVFGNRNSPTVIYAALHSMQFWDGRAKTIEQQAQMPILNPIEHGIPDKAFLENRLKNNPEYISLFKKAFPEDSNPINFANIGKAIGAFEKQLLPKSKFDEYLEGNDTALTEQQKKGLTSFIDNGCITCHTGVALGGQMLQKFGVYGDYKQYTHSKNVDKGLFDLTKKEGDQFMFKVPGLRNIEKTGPFFHDGSVSSLKEAVKIMGKLQLNKDISEEDAVNIVEFLKSLTADIDDKYKR